MFDSIKNPNAGASQIFLAFLYAAVVGGLAAWAVYCWICGDLSGVGLENISF